MAIKEKSILWVVTPMLIIGASASYCHAVSEAPLTGVIRYSNAADAEETGDREGEILSLWKSKEQFQGQLTLCEGGCYDTEVFDVTRSNKAIGFAVTIESRSCKFDGTINEEVVKGVLICDGKNGEQSQSQKEFSRVH